MTFPLAGLGTKTPATAKPARAELGRDQFLHLLVTQLKFQDPLSPLAPDAFAAQLAQFSSVEQLTKLNETIASQQQDSTLRTLLDKTMLGASLIGRHIVAEGNDFTADSSGNGTIRVNVGAAGGKATLVLLDGNGVAVSSQAAGVVRGGSQIIKISTGLPAGTYHYRLDVESATGARVSAQTLTDGVVDGVVFEGGIVWLKVGNRKIQLDKLSEITP